MTSPPPQIIGSDDSHDTLRRVLATRTPCKVLDAPTGQGPIAMFLKELGWNVHCADIDRGNFKLSDLPFSEVNLNRSLPFEAASFDAVVCANGLHRLFNPGAAISEFYRIIRDGGTLFINLNNYASFERRIRFVLYGSIERALNEGCCQQTIEEPEAHVRMALLYPQLANMLERAGFEVVSVLPAARRWYHYAAVPAGLGLRCLVQFVPLHERKRNHLHVTASRAICPGGRYLFIEARR